MSEAIEVGTGEANHERRISVDPGRGSEQRMTNNSRRRSASLAGIHPRGRFNAVQTTGHSNGLRRHAKPIGDGVDVRTLTYEPSHLLASGRSFRMCQRL